MTSPSTDPMTDLESAALALSQHRQRPLLILFYPPLSRMGERDMAEVYQAFRRNSVTVETKLPQLDVLLDSWGGNPVAAYRIAQLIRDMVKDVAFLVPERAYSAATLLSLSGDEVRLGHYAGLSPIDITLVSESERGRSEVELATIDGFIDFARRARQVIEEQLRKMEGGNTNVDSELLVAMVHEVGALQVAKFFRERNLTRHYAKELLYTYMFADFSDRAERSEDLSEKLVHGAPSHSFHLDYHFCDNWKLVVKEMTTDESDLSKKVVTELENLTSQGVICKRLSRKFRMPFFWLYGHTQANPSTGSTT
ncbi:MAG TPA: hypothetical protein VKP61_09665 [Candidatus Acidoferrum sp.]|nr:hypothetical protein [Candidatus Acidoferrum sp.]